MRIRFVIISLIVLSTVLCGSAYAERSGQCGNTVYWSLSDTGTMTITGEGRMWDFRNDADFFDYHPCPWENDRDTIRKVVFSNGITYIGASNFEFCPNLEEVDIPSSLEDIGCFSFFFCKSLDGVILPDGLKAIGQQAFFRTNISSLVIPGSVGFVDGEIAGHCPNLTSVVFKKRESGGYVMGNCPFRSCPNLKAITVETSHVALYDDDGVLYDGDILIQYPQGKTSEHYTVNPNCKEIFQFAFDMDSSYPEYLTSITLPHGVESIDSVAFHDGLQSIDLPDTLSYIDEGAFQWCYQLSQVNYAGSKSEWNNICIGEHNENLFSAQITYGRKDIMVLPANLKVIEAEAFLGISDVIVRIPDSVTSIAENAFNTSVTVQCGAGSYAYHRCTELGLDIEIVP